jgi:hypothetical protein
MLNSVLCNRNILHSTTLLIYKPTVKSILIYGAETWSIKLKHRHQLLATEMDYLWRSAKLSGMDRFRNETIRTKMGMKKDILQEIEEQKLRCYGHVVRMEGCRIARQVAECNPQGKGGAADHSIHGRMGLGTACKGETSWMKNVRIESSGRKRLYLWFEENCAFTEKFLYSLYKTVLFIACSIQELQTCGCFNFTRSLRMQQLEIR